MGAISSSAICPTDIDRIRLIYCEGVLEIVGMGRLHEGILNIDVMLVLSDRYK